MFVRFVCLCVCWYLLRVLCVGCLLMILFVFMFGVGCLIIVYCCSLIFALVACWFVCYDRFGVAVACLLV